jgi:hypothetical protein
MMLDAFIQNSDQLFGGKLGGGMASTCTTASTGPASQTFTLEALKRTMRLLDEAEVHNRQMSVDLFRAGYFNPFGALRVVESPHCTVRKPVRPHRRKRWDRSGKYHARIAKKWLKRFGEREEAVAYMLDPKAIGHSGGPMFLLHPSHAAMLRNMA